MAFVQSISNSSPMTNCDATAAQEGPSRIVSYDDEASTTSSIEAPVVICITGEFSNIECKYLVNPSRVLGSGCQGSVRECIARATGQRCAVKSICKNNSAVNPDGIAREITMLREMNHDNIVRLIDVYEDVEYVHLVTDLCDGGELFDKIVERSASSESACFGEDEAAIIVNQILTAVFYMHERNIAHRDIKPENIMFETADGIDSPVKIIDFGLSRKHHASREPAMSTLVGTPYYIAPEVLQGRYDKSCDLWSVGVIAYILLCGYPPFNGANNDQTHRSVLKGKYYFPVEDWENISREAMDFIHRLLQMDPRKRMTAEDALSHPWILKHRRSNVIMDVEKERQDKSSVKDVHSDTPRKQQIPAQCGTSSPYKLFTRKPLPLPGQCGNSSRRRSSSKLRMSMFAY